MSYRQNRCGRHRLFHHKQIVVLQVRCDQWFATITCRGQKQGGEEVGERENSMKALKPLVLETFCISLSEISLS